MVSSNQFKGVLPQDPRAAQSNAALQQQAYQQQMAKNQAYGAAHPITEQNPQGTVLGASAANVRAQQMQGPKVDAFGQPTDVGMLNQYQQNAGGTNHYFNQTGTVSTVTRALPNISAPAGSSLDLAQKLQRGEITQEQFRQQRQALMFPTPPAPSWLGGGTLEQQAQQAGADARKRAQDAGQGNSMLLEQVESQAKQNFLNEAAANLNVQNAQSTRQSQSSTVDAAAGSAAATSSRGAAAKNQQGMATQAPMVDPGLSAAVGLITANLPPEAQALGPVLQNYLAQSSVSMQQQSALAGFQFNQAEQQYQQGASVLNNLMGVYERTKNDAQSLLDKVREDSEKNISAQEDAAQARLEWTEQQQLRDANELKRKTIEAKVANAALRGGYMNDGTLRDIEAANSQFEQAIRDIRTEFGIQRTDLSARFTAMHTEANNKYAFDALQNIKAFNAEMERISFQDLALQGARDAAKSKAMETLVNSHSATRKETAEKLIGFAKEAYGMIRQQKEEKRAEEENALGKIEYLLKNYPRESVAEAIKELGKSVTSFNVQTFIDNPTFAEIEKAKVAAKARSYSGGGGGGYVNSFLPLTMQEPAKPEVSMDEFMSQKIAGLEKIKLQSFDPAKRAQILEENEDQWQKEYEAIYLSGPRGAMVGEAKSDLAQQFGQDVVDAAQLVMDGTYTGTDPVGKAAKAMNVPASQVATALTKLKQTGAVAESAILSPAQQKSRDTIISGLKTDPFYTVWNGAKSAVSRINVAIGDNGGADGLSDIMAINAFQNGIVDPGATVREGDVSLMQTAIAWADLVNLTYWKERISDGDKLPASMRQKMLQLATSTRDAYEQDFRTQTVPKAQSLIRQNGLPANVLDDYLGASTTTIVSPDVADFVDSLPLP